MGTLGLKGLLKPQYILHPKQILRRIAWAVGMRPRTPRAVMLPWGLPLLIDSRDNIGENIWLHGIYDLALTEALWRLTQRDDTAVDVGANIGYTASILCAQVGKNGKVYTFEPHPQLFQALLRNVESWKVHPNSGEIIAQEVAVSARNGKGCLKFFADFDRNNGTSAITENVEDSTKNVLPVRLARLDSIIPEGTPIAVLKVDVEGHELEVFRGLGKLLESKVIRDIVFEETSAYPGPTHQYLQSAGYSVLGLESNFWGVQLVPPDRVKVNPYFPSNYIATCERARAEDVFQSRGWCSLGGGSRRYRGWRDSRPGKPH